MVYMIEILIEKTNYCHYYYPFNSRYIYSFCSIHIEMEKLIEKTNYCHCKNFVKSPFNFNLQLLYVCVLLIYVSLFDMEETINNCFSVIISILKTHGHNFMMYCYNGSNSTLLKHKPFFSFS